MKLLDEYEISRLAFYECKKGNDNSEMRKLITDSWWAYKYCLRIKDKKEMWSKITDPESAEEYCYFVKNRPEVRKICETIE